MLRTLLLVASVLPVVAGSMALADWARHDPNSIAQRNSVWRCTPSPSMDQDAATPTAPLTARCEEVATHWRQAIPPDHNVIVRAPLVIAGNLPAEQLERVYARTAAPALAALAAQFCERRPEAPISLLVFKDEASYRQAAWRLFGQRQLSIYGYYKPSRRTIVINLDAGEGTLVHELFHALVEFDFPDIPIWLNEGIASLYEQCEIDWKGEAPYLVPRLNWRLLILSEALAEGSLPSLNELAHSAHFRGPMEATKYAHARYFCMFLREQGWLQRFYQEFRAEAHTDPTGLATLMQTTGQTIHELDLEFRRWAESLTVNDDSDLMRRPQDGA